MMHSLWWGGATVRYNYAAMKDDWSDGKAWLGHYVTTSVVTGAQQRGERERWEENWARHLNEAPRCEVCDTQYYSKQNQEHSYLHCFHLYTMKEYLTFLCLAHLVCWSGPNLMKPISIRTILFPRQRARDQVTRLQQPMCLNIPHWRSVSWGWQLYTEIMNVFMLKLTHFKSLTFELFSLCSPIYWIHVQNYHLKCLPLLGFIMLAFNLFMEVAKGQKL